MNPKSTLILADYMLPLQAKEKLSAWGNVEGFSTEGLVFPAISGHPAIFFCKIPNLVITAPNLPQKWFLVFEKYGVKYMTGNLNAGISTEKKSIPHTALVHYMAAVNDEFLVHAIPFTDPVIIQQCHYLKKIAVKQGFTLSHLLLLDDGHYITSDKGIDDTMKQHGLHGLFVSPAGIRMEGFQNGGIGGTTGIHKNTIFFTGSLSQYPEGQEVKQFLEDLHYEIIELSDGPLIDTGGILFL
jgi:hypothetical protein